MQKGKTTYICPEFKIGSKRSDLMTKGGKFYAIWDEDNSNLWSTYETDVQRLIDKDLDNYILAHPKYEDYPKMQLNDFSNGKWTEWKSM